MSKSVFSPRVILAVLCVPVFMAGLDAFVVNVAFDAINGSYPNQHATEISWVLNSYLIVFAAMLVPFGRFADYFGSKRVFLFGVAVFTLASALCALSPTFWALVAFRGLQAVGAAAMIPSSLALILTLIPAENRASAIKTWAATSGMAAAAGPLAGGLLVEAGWRWIFLINVPVGIVGLVAAVVVLRDFRKESAQLPDMASAALFTVAAAAITFALVESSGYGWGDTRVLGGFALCVTASAVFVWRSVTSPSALIPPVLFSARSYSWSSITALLFSIGFGGSMLAIILWMQQVQGYSALQTGFAVFPGPLMVPIFGVVAQRAVAKYGPAATGLVGCLIVGIGGAALAAVTFVVPDSIAAVIVAWTFMGIGLGVALPTILGSATAELPPQLASTGSAVVNMARQLGMSIGVALLLAVLDSSIASSVEDRFAVAWIGIAAFSTASAATAMGMRVKRDPVSAGAADSAVVSR